MHIGVYNSRADKQPVTFDIQMREKLSQDCLGQDMKVKNEVFNLVHEGTDAHETSEIERDEKDL